MVPGVEFNVGPMACPAHSDKELGPMVKFGARYPLYWVKYWMCLGPIRPESGPESGYPDGKLDVF